MINFITISLLILNYLLTYQIKKTKLIKYFVRDTTGLKK